MFAVPAAVLAVAACSPAGSGTSPPASFTPAAAPAATAPPSPPPAAPVKVASNITIAAADGALPGPEKITFTSCGKLTPAQQSQFGTNAAAGLTYRFTNQAAVAASPQVAVNFLEGSTVVTSNVSDGAAALISPGQTASGEVDAVSASGQPVTFTSCEVMHYLLIAGHGTPPTQYAG